MIEYIIASSIWSLAGFAAGWFASSRFQRLEQKVDRIEQVVEGNRAHDK